MANNTRESAWNTLTAQTSENIAREAQDNWSDQRVLFNYLKARGRLDLKGGGTQIVYPLWYQAQAATFYAEDAVIAIPKVEGVSAATYDWKYSESSTTISGPEKRKNSGESQMIDMLKTKKEQMFEGYYDLLDTAFWADTPASANDPWGIGALVNDEAGDTANSNVVGGISTASAAATWWESVVKDGTPTTGDYGADGLNTGLVLRKAMRSAANEASGDTPSQKVDGWFGPYNCFEAIEDSMVTNVRYQDKQAAGVGFENIAVNGVPLYPTNAATADTVFGIPSRFIKLIGHQDNWMRWSGFTVNPVDSTYSTGGVGGWRDTQYGTLTSDVQLGINNRRRFIRINNIVSSIA